MKFIDFFAGIGGIRSGFEQAGMQCVGYVEWDKYARKSYEAIYDTEGEYTGYDIQEVKGTELPDEDIWCSGFPCTNISVAGTRTGLGGEQSRMFFEVIRCAKERIRAKKTLPQYIFIENVKNLLSSNQGRDFAELLYQMGQIGYDPEWAVIDSSDVVPQHRERIYIVGHLRGERFRKVFPIQRQGKGPNRKPKINYLYKEDHYNSDTVVGIDGISPTIVATSYKHPQKIELNKNKIKQVGNFIKTASFGGNPQVGRVYDPSGVSPTLNTMQGGNRQPKILVVGNTSKTGYRSHDVVDEKGISKTIDATSYKHKPQVLVRAVLTPDRINKRQNGRRFKTDGEPSFTLTAADRHGVMLDEQKDDNNGVWYHGKAIRKLTPLECWRLQGFSDEAFYKAKNAGVSNSQLYKQAGNSVTVPVIRAIAEKIAEVSKD